MTAKKSAKKAVKKAPARKRIQVAREARGLAAAEIALALDAPEVATLVESVRKAGGAPLAAYREPLAGRPLLLAALPRDAVEPTPFQRAQELAADAWGAERSWFLLNGASGGNHAICLALAVRALNRVA